MGKVIRDGGKPKRSLKRKGFLAAIGLAGFLAAISFLNKKPEPLQQPTPAAEAQIRATPAPTLRPTQTVTLGTPAATPKASPQPTAKSERKFSQEEIQQADNIIKGIKKLTKRVDKLINDIRNGNIDFEDVKKEQKSIEAKRLEIEKEFIKVKMTKIDNEVYRSSYAIYSIF